MIEKHKGHIIASLLAIKKEIVLNKLEETKKETEWNFIEKRNILKKIYLKK